MPLPNFFILGAAKSGTTALHHYLEQHPDIFMSPKKEPNYFNRVPGGSDYFEPLHSRWKNWREPSDTLEAYLALFEGANGARARGEATPWYLYEDGVAQRIAHDVPAAKLIAVLRQPVDRAYSNFTQCRQDAKEPIADFAEAFAAGDDRARKNWHPFWRYRDLGFYTGQLKRYFEVFGREQVRVYLYDHLQNDAVALCRDVFRFLGVDDRFAPDISIRHKASGVPRSRGVQLLLSRPNPVRKLAKRLLPAAARKRVFVNLQQANLRDAPRLSTAVRCELTECYREDIRELQNLIGCDLTRWLA